VNEFAGGFVLGGVAVGMAVVLHALHAPLLPLPWLGVLVIVSIGLWMFDWLERG
jgi:hypothetical protein